MTLDERMDEFFAHKPAIHPSAFVAPTAAVIGHVTLEEESSVWYHTVLRADINRIHLGPRSNIQDGSVVHLADDYPVIIGELVTIGHKAMIHACTIADECLIGMGAIILDGAEIGPRCIIGAGAVVTSGVKIPEGSLVLGTPGKIVKKLDMEAQKKIKHWAEKYVGVSRRFLQHVRENPTGVYL
jgi:gamma-carbonic anhydrase